MPARSLRLASLTVAVALTSTLVLRGQDVQLHPTGSGDRVRLLPTNHPAVPADPSGFWVVPARAAASAEARQLAQAIAHIGAGDFARGLPLVSAAGLENTEFRGYAQYYRAVALIALNRAAEADAVLTRALDQDVRGYLREALRTRAVEVALSVGAPARAVDLADDLVEEKIVAPEAAWLLLGRAAEAAGDVDKALTAYRTIYYEFPTSSQAAEADTAIGRLQTPNRIPPDKYALDLERAEKLFAARRWAQARAAFEPLARVAPGDDKELIALRLAECDYYLDRYRASRDALVPLIDKGSRRAEARYFHLSAVRSLGDRATYVQLARRLVADHPDSPWAADTLHNLASHYITTNEDDAADEVFRELARRFPKHPHSERAAWKVGWRAYRAGNYREAAETFERAAETFPRADYRPGWLYWAARARTQLREPALAAQRYSIVIADYQNSYYGRLAMRTAAQEPTFVRAAATVRIASTAEPIPTESLIRELITVGLYDDALREVRYAQRVWGDSARLQATTAFIRHNQGVELKAQERFTAIRGAINTMRRAYPQFMAAGGEHLPAEVLRIIFPLDYWPLITKYSAAHDLDPYLIAALMAQESTFTAEIRSSANAIGLMQIIPATGRRYARILGVQNFTTNALTRPELNVRLGTKYFKDLMTRFGGEAHFALASYNAGENRVDRWRAERGPLPADEFVDDIPFPETQNYVKRILGTAEDYRRLYGEGLLDPNVPLAGARAQASRRSADRVAVSMN